MRKENVERLNHVIEQNGLFTYITARDFTSSKKIMNKVKINIPVSVSNGAAVIDFKTGWIHKCDTIPKQEVEELVKMAQEYSMNPNMVVNKAGYLKSCYVAVESQKNRIQYRETLEKFPEYSIEVDCVKNVDFNSVISMSLVERRDKISALYEQMQLRNFKAISIHYFYDALNDEIAIIEIESSTVSKGKAAYEIVQMVKEDTELEVIVFGNGKNDLSMFQYADKAIAVGNVEEDLLSKADIQLEYNQGDSVTHYICKEIGEV